MYKERLKEIRDIKDVKQKEIADFLKLSTSSYATYENEIDIFPIKHLVRTCDYFDVSIDYVFNFVNSYNYQNLSQGMDLIKMGKRLKEFRKENKIAQRQLADILKSDNSTISKYEKGVNIISTSFLYEICKKYKVSADYLLGRTDIPNIRKKV